MIFYFQYVHDLTKHNVETESKLPETEKLLKAAVETKMII